MILTGMLTRVALRGLLLCFLGLGLLCWSKGADWLPWVCGAGLSWGALRLGAAPLAPPPGSRGSRATQPRAGANIDPGRAFAVSRSMRDGSWLGTPRQASSPRGLPDPPWVPPSARPGSSRG